MAENRKHVGEEWRFGAVDLARLRRREANQRLGHRQPDHVHALALCFFGQHSRRLTMINFCQFGAGRIGAIHAGNIARHPGARLRIIVDADRTAAERLAALHGAAVASAAEALADPAVDAVVIASSTDTHADLVEAGARAGKAIFCEKPLDLDRRRAEACAAVAASCGVPLMVAFNRRFDPHFAELHRRIKDGRIGRPEILTITSYDPAPPPIEFVRRSGGLFRDMMIHDLDMACWLWAKSRCRVFAMASVPSRSDDRRGGGCRYRHRNAAHAVGRAGPDLEQPARLLRL